MPRLIRMTLLSVLVLLVVACGESKKTPAQAGDGRGGNKPPKADAALLEQGQTLFWQNCANCHGDTGKGDGPVGISFNPPPRDFGDRNYMSKLSDAEIRKTIKEGGMWKNMPMMPPNPQYTESELAALVAHVRSFSATGMNKKTGN